MAITQTKTRHDGRVSDLLSVVIVSRALAPQASDYEGSGKYTGRCNSNTNTLTFVAHKGCICYTDVAGVGCEALGDKSQQLRTHVVIRARETCTEPDVHPAISPHRKRHPRPNCLGIPGAVFDDKGRFPRFDNSRKQNISDIRIDAGILWRFHCVFYSSSWEVFVVSDVWKPKQH